MGNKFRFIPITLVRTPGLVPAVPTYSRRRNSIAAFTIQVRIDAGWLVRQFVNGGPLSEFPYATVRVRKGSGALHETPIGCAFFGGSTQDYPRRTGRYRSKAQPAVPLNDIGRGWNGRFTNRETACFSRLRRNRLPLSRYDSFDSSSTVPNGHGNRGKHVDRRNLSASRSAV